MDTSVSLKYLSKDLRIYVNLDLHTRTHVRTKTAIETWKRLSEFRSQMLATVSGSIAHVDNHGFGCGGQISYRDMLQPACM